MAFVALVTLLILCQYVVFMGLCGKARAESGLLAPAVVGDESFERAYRVQMNTLEQLIVFVLAMLLFSSYVSARWVWIPGLLFIVGRQLYAMEYVNKPSTRVPGMALTLLANTVLLVGSLVAVVIKMF